MKEERTMKRMLINATQAEERRLAIVDGQKLLDYEIEIEGREQRKGNIYKAVVTRVEPSLEACFVDYGEDRHGFLPFKEISKQYFAQGVSVSQARIQDVIREGNELLVQVEKEERGNKGAALTTFVSLAGRYVVLMPNNPRGGGVSRRIEGEDRAELKENMDQLEYPQGASIIARTAGIGRSAPELQWDLNYLIKLWTAIDGASKAGKGAFLIYQESSLVIRAIRDYFSAEIGDILIDTDDIYEQAHQFMAHVMPEHAARVKRYRDDAPLFSRFQIEHQIASAYSRTVTLPSGGAIVIDHTEALVSVDVNSARAIKGGDIEDTATRTNLEAADEVARQMRLRDLGGLIVIDFIDMEESRNRRDVENRLRDALRQDRARVQFGTISKFGLMEMSRQRLRPALSEGASIPCPRCGGSGHIRDTESSALEILRIIQEESMKDNTAALHCQVPVDVASFLLNEKRTEITKIELKQRMTVLMIPSKILETPNYKLERLKHDDPRLDNVGVSYKMADEPEDTEVVTRRSQEPTNKQTPIIKGVLPDAPAPMPLVAPVLPGKPEPARNAMPAARPRDAAPLVKPAVAAETGFFAWIKNLFGGKEDAAPARPAASAATPARADGRLAPRGGERDGPREGNRNGDGRDGGRDGGRGNRGGRGGRGRNGEARGGEGRRDEGRGEVRAEGRDEPRNEMRNEGGREPAREPARDGESRENTGRGRRGEPRQGRRDGTGDTEQKPATGLAPDAPSTDAPSAERGEARGGRGERAEGRRERSGRGERGSERTGERVNERINERPPRSAEAEAGTDTPAPRSYFSTPGQIDNAQASDMAIDARPADESGDNAPRSNAGGRGRGRGRDRDRDRDDQRNPAGGSERSPDNQPAAQQSAMFEPAQEPVEFVSRLGNAPAHPSNVPVQPSAEANALVAPIVAPIVSAPTPSMAVLQAPVAVIAMPAVAAPVAPSVVLPIALPVADLAALAASAGLQWVQSDTQKVASVQAAIAAEALAPRVPRERPASVVSNEGPLVLVETRRDLRELKLPFDAAADANNAASNAS